MLTAEKHLALGFVLQILHPQCWEADTILCKQRRPTAPHLLYSKVSNGLEGKKLYPK